MTASRAQQGIDVDVPDELKFWTVAEFAVLMSANEHTVRRKCRAGEIAWIPWGRYMRIPDTERVRLLTEAQSARSA